MSRRENFESKFKTSEPLIRNPNRRSLVRNSGQWDFDIETSPVKNENGIFIDLI